METLFTTLNIYATVVLVAVTCIFFISRAISKNSIMDIAYGPIYLIATWTTLFSQKSFNGLSILAAFLISLWALRIAVRIFKKNWQAPEDPRYANWSKEWSKKGRLYLYLRSYLQVNILQGLVIILVSAPIIVILSANESLTLSPVLLLGLITFIFGLSYESIADHQLDTFIRQKKAGETTIKVLNQGLFSLSRRPNYFGEAALWWGLAIMTLSLPLGPLAVIGPITITYILYKVTGPMLEKLFLEKYPEEYEVYQAQTNYFIPGVPRKKV